MHDIDQPKYPSNATAPEALGAASGSGERPTRKFLCSYFHDGGWWSLMIDAYDMADAERRVARLGNLRLDGEHIFTAKLPTAAGAFYFAAWVFAVTLILCSLVDGPFAARVGLGILTLASLTGHQLTRA